MPAMPGENGITISLTMESDALEILNRLRGKMEPSAFIQLLLRMADSGAVGPIPESVRTVDQRNK
jgi:hypothetical protein